MNAISPGCAQDAADRTARHMRQCAELADLAMQLARLAAAKALAQPAEQEAAPAAEPQSEPQPAAKPGAPARAAAPSLRAPTCKSIDPALLFTRLATIVRTCIALESRLAAGLPAGYRPAATPPCADSRRDALREAARRVFENHPDRAEALEEFEIRLDEELEDEEAHLASNFAILNGFCMGFGIEPDPAFLPPGFERPENPFARSRSPP